MALKIPVPLENFARRYSRYYIYLEPVVADPLIRSYFSFVASLLLVAFFLVFALSPTINTILTLQKKIGEERKIDAALTQKIINLTLAQDSFSQATPGFLKLLAAIPTDPSPQTIASGVVKSASDSGLTVSGLQFADVAIGDPPHELTTLKFSFTVTGPREQVRQFLGKVENLPRQVRIETLAVAFGNKSDVSVAVSAIGYYLGAFYK